MTVLADCSGRPEAFVEGELELDGVSDQKEKGFNKLVSLAHSQL